MSEWDDESEGLGAAPVATAQPAAAPPAQTAQSANQPNYAAPPAMAIGAGIPAQPPQGMAFNRPAGGVQTFHRATPWDIETAHNDFQAEQQASGPAAQPSSAQTPKLGDISLTQPSYTWDDDPAQIAGLVQQWKEANPGKALPEALASTYSDRMESARKAQLLQLRSENPQYAGMKDDEVLKAHLDAGEQQVKGAVTQWMRQTMMGNGGTDPGDENALKVLKSNPQFLQQAMVATQLPDMYQQVQDRDARRQITGSPLVGDTPQQLQFDLAVRDAWKQRLAHNMSDQWGGLGALMMNSGNMLGMGLFSPAVSSFQKHVLGGSTEAEQDVPTMNDVMAQSQKDHPLLSAMGTAQGMMGPNMLAGPMSKIFGPMANAITNRIAGVGGSALVKAGEQVAAPSFAARAAGGMAAGATAQVGLSGALNLLQGNFKEALDDINPGTKNFWANALTGAGLHGAGALGQEVAAKYTGFQDWMNLSKAGKSYVETVKDYGGTDQDVSTMTRAARFIDRWKATGNMHQAAVDTGISAQDLADTARIYNTIKSKGGFEPNAEPPKGPQAQKEADFEGSVVDPNKNPSAPADAPIVDKLAIARTKAGTDTGPAAADVLKKPTEELFPSPPPSPGEATLPEAAKPKFPEELASSKEVGQWYGNQFGDRSGALMVEAMASAGPGKYVLRQVPTDKLNPNQLMPTDTNQAKVDAMAKLPAETSPPVIAVPGSGDQLMVADGGHRLAAAKQRGDASVLAYVPEHLAKGFSKPADDLIQSGGESVQPLQPRAAVQPTATRGAAAGAQGIQPAPGGAGGPGPAIIPGETTGRAAGGPVGVGGQSGLGGQSPLPGPPSERGGATGNLPGPGHPGGQSPVRQVGPVGGQPVHGAGGGYPQPQPASAPGAGAGGLAGQNPPGGAVPPIAGGRKPVKAKRPARGTETARGPVDPKTGLPARVVADLLTSTRPAHKFSGKPKDRVVAGKQRLLGSMLQNFVRSMHGAPSTPEESLQPATQFTKSAIAQKLIDAHHATNPDEAERQERAEDEAGAGGESSRTFLNKLPGEIKKYIQDNPSSRRLFKVTDDPTKSLGEDAMTSMGDDYWKMIERQAGGKPLQLERALESARNSDDPQMQFLAALHDTMPAAADRPKQFTADPDKMQEGETATINKIPVKVVEGDDGLELKDADDLPTTPLDALESVPLDRGSLEGPAHTDPESHRQLLQTAYNQFVDKHGPLHLAANAAANAEDPLAPALLSIEEWDAARGKAKLAAVLQNSLGEAPNFTEPLSVAEKAEQRAREMAQQPPMFQNVPAEEGPTKPGEIGTRTPAPVDVNRQLGLHGEGEIGAAPGQADLFNTARYKLMEQARTAAVPPQFRPEHTEPMFPQSSTGGGSSSSADLNPAGGAKPTPTPANLNANLPPGSNLFAAAPAGKPLVPLPMPEMVKLAQELMGGKFPLVRKSVMRGRAGGVFRSGGGKPIQIEIAADKFKSTLEAAATLAHEIGHLEDFLPKGGVGSGTMKRGNLLGRLIKAKKYLKKMAPGIGVPNSAIRKELIRLSEWWSPYDATKAPPAYIQYRNSPAELYAEALSVLLNAPGEVQTRSPLFFQAFSDMLNQHEPFKTDWLNLQDLLQGKSEELMAARRADVREDYASGEDARRAREFEARATSGSLEMAIKQNFLDTGAPVMKRAKGWLKVDPDNASAQAARNALDAMTHRNNPQALLQMNLNETVDDQLAPNGLTQADLGEYLQMKRVAAGDRTELANPRGHTKETAQQMLGDLQKTLGPAAWDKLEELAKVFHGHLNELTEQAADVGYYSQKQYAETIQPNQDNYAKFSVIEHLKDYVPARIMAQVGTFKAVENPYVSTTLYMHALSRAIDLQRTKLAVEKAMLEHEPDNWISTKAPIIGTAGSGEDAHPIYGDPPRAPKGKGYVVVMRDGKPDHMLTDKYIANIFDSPDLASLRTIGHFLGKLTYPVFHPLYVIYNQAWATALPFRDVPRAFEEAMPMLPSSRPQTSPVRILGDAAELAKEVLKAFPAAISRTRGRITPELKEMIGARALPIIGHEYDEESELESLDRLAARLGAGPGGLQGRVASLLHNVTAGAEALGNTMWALPKIAVWRIGARRGMPQDQLAYIVRKFGGHANRQTRGLLTSFNNGTFMYSNVAAQFWSADLEAATNPRSKMGFWIRALLVAGVPAALMVAAGAGAFGPATKKRIDSIPDYDRSNYTIIPLPGGYIRIPRTAFDRLLFGELQKIVSDPIHGKTAMETLQDMGKFAWSQVPSLSPALNAAQMWGAYLRGTNPYDSFRAHNVMTEDEQRAGGTAAFKQMFKWQMNQFGEASIIMEPLLKKLGLSYSNARNGTQTAVSATPFLSRFWKEYPSEADQAREERATALAAREKRQAQFRLARQGAIR